MSDVTRSKHSFLILFYGSTRTFANFQGYGPATQVRWLQETAAANHPAPMGIARSRMQPPAVRTTQIVQQVREILQKSQSRQLF